ncbi:hypothetical protein BMS3Bbin08_02475 [bacterium BMS3Bbin08]|nr:hypothetical protein BMS3Bbin08_02475 [bacterium BMS3Bbin08]
MRKELFYPSEDGEARLLLLISAFSKGDKCLEGRTKLAKLDFLLRYPSFLCRALEIRGAGKYVLSKIVYEEDIETKMVRYRYGPWDPAYYALLGRLIGKRLITPIPFKGGIGFKVTNKGLLIAGELSESLGWAEVAERIKMLKSKFDVTGTTLTKFIYNNFPEVVSASWGEKL